MPTSFSNTENDTKGFFILFLFITGVVAFPSTFVYYASPIILVILAIFGYGILNIGKLIVTLVIIIIFTILSLSIDYMRDYTINIPGAIMSLLLYLPLIIFLTRKNTLLFNDAVNNSIINFICYFVIVQGLIGFVQMVLSSNWDAVSGSFGLFDFYTGNFTISQVMYTFNIFIMILFLIPYSNRVLVKCSIIIGVFAVALAQSGHQTIFFIISIFAVYSSLKNIKRTMLIFMGLFGFIICVLLFFPKTPFLVSTWYHNLFFGNFPKVLVVNESLALLSEIKVLLFGTGLGQFSSRAALFSTGDYLSIHLPDIITGKSAYFLERISPLLDLQEKVGQSSAIAKPYFSILSITIELGALVTLFLVYLLWKEVKRNNRFINNSTSKEQLFLSKFLNATILFFLLCCTIENYAEFVQAIMLPIMLYIYAIGRVKHINAI